MKSNKSLFSLILIFGLGLLLSSCSEDETPSPKGDNEDEEVISQVVLTFTPENGGDVVTATWLDADGEGAGAPKIDKIALVEGTKYTLTMKLANTLADPDEDKTSEIQKEDHEHMFFFSFTEGLFSDPTGNGNIDNRADTLIYNDKDENGLPVGLSTTWTAGGHSETTKEFKVILKHQPDGQKTASSNATVGGTDVDITFPIDIVEDPNEEEEVINEVVLTFTPTGGGNAITAKWFDADGEGVGNPTIDNINLAANTAYEMSITLANTLGTEREDVTAEVKKEDQEHMFFFEFTNDIFTTPAGNGNVDNRADALVYNDQDENNNPIGLSTNWTTGGAKSGNDFKVILKHQPKGLKTTTSGSNVGGTDINIAFSLSIQ